MSNSFFDKSGQINASSFKDSLMQLAKFASILEENQPSNLGLAGQPSVSDDQRDSLVSQAIQTQEGKIALAQAMANPIN